MNITQTLIIQKNNLVESSYWIVYPKVRHKVIESKNLSKRRIENLSVFLNVIKIINCLETHRRHMIKVDFFKMWKLACSRNFVDSEMRYCYVKKTEFNSLSSKIFPKIITLLLFCRAVRQTITGKALINFTFVEMINKLKKFGKSAQKRLRCKGFRHPSWDVKNSSIQKEKI